MEKEQTKKCFCARCFLPVEAEDKVDIEGQSFHKVCSMCCICRRVPTSIKMFYGHMFCNECFKTHVLSRFRGEQPQLYSSSWWMQWAPGNNRPQEKEDKNKEEEPTHDDQKEEKPGKDSAKRSICARCLQPVDECTKVEIGGQSFHECCAKCCVCHTVPSENLKIYYGNVFCEDCFHRHILSRNRDNPAEFFKTCFEQMQGSPLFADGVRQFLNGGDKEGTPLIFMMQGAQQGGCKCGGAHAPQDWCQKEPKKCA